MTMNTEDENRDEIEAQEVWVPLKELCQCICSIICGQLDQTGRFKAARMTVKLDGDIIMGEIAATADKRYLNPAYGSLEDMG